MAFEPGAARGGCSPLLNGVTTGWRLTNQGYWPLTKCGLSSVHPPSNPRTAWNSLKKWRESWAVRFCYKHDSDVFKRFQKCPSQPKRISKDVTLPLFSHTFWETWQTLFGHSRSVLILNALRCEDRLGLHQAKATLKQQKNRGKSSQRWSKVSYIHFPTSATILYKHMTYDTTLSSIYL